MKSSTLGLILGGILMCSSAYADEGEISSEALVKRFDNAAEKARLSSESNLIKPTRPSPTKPSPDEAKIPGKSKTDQMIDDLVREVDSLQSKVIVNQQVALSTQKPRTAKLVGSRTTYAFKEGDVYEIRAGVDRVTDIELEQGETLSSAPVSGDTVRWKISIVKTSKKGKETTHIIIKPLDSEIESNLVVITSKRTYHLRIISSDWYMPSVSWNYPQDEEPISQETESKLETEEIALRPEDLEFGYEVSGRNYPWTPVRVFDDGKKTYLQMPKSAQNHESPALFVIESDDVVLVNYHVKGRYYIIDRLIEHAQLRVGSNRIVDIWTKDSKPSFFERLF